MSEEKTDINLTQEELETLKIICDFLFFDQLKHMASFPRFESCFGATLTNENRTDYPVHMHTGSKNSRRNERAADPRPLSGRWRALVCSMLPEMRQRQQIQRAENAGRGNRQMERDAGEDQEEPAGRDKEENPTWLCNGSALLSGSPWRVRWCWYAANQKQETGALTGHITVMDSGTGVGAWQA